MSVEGGEDRLSLSKISSGESGISTPYTELMKKQLMQYWTKYRVPIDVIAGNNGWQESSVVVEKIGKLKEEVLRQQKKLNEQMFNYNRKCNERSSMTNDSRAKLHHEASLPHDLDLKWERKDKELNRRSCTSLDNIAHVPHSNLHSLQRGELNHTTSFSKPPISRAMHDRELGARPKVMKFPSKAKHNSEFSAEPDLDIKPSGISPLNGKAEEESESSRSCIGMSPDKRKCRNKLSAEPDLDKNARGISPLNVKVEEVSEASRFCFGISPDKRKCRNELSAKPKINMLSGSISCIKGDPEEESQDDGLSTGTHLTHEPQVTRTSYRWCSRLAKFCCLRRAPGHQCPSTGIIEKESHQSSIKNEQEEAVPTRDQILRRHQAKGIRRFLCLA
ncbi:uncharacterized protein [Ambystoma mexicanum]|uniref:uncharacterized protein n=1 Tax=Ambystoma mexicanum TaxID=8296 RepID=UPI0037E99903